MSFSSLLRLVIAKKRKAFLRLSGIYQTSMIRALGGQCGKGMAVDRGFIFKHPPHEGIRFGRDVNIGKNVVIDVPEGGKLTLGDRVKLTMDIVIASSSSVHIGDDTQIAEFCSIRDADHGIAIGIKIAAQELTSDPVTIGNDVWIARGVAVLRGSHIGDGAVVGANAVVKGVIPAGGIAVGTPAKVVKMRT